MSILEEFMLEVDAGYVFRTLDPEPNFRNIPSIEMLFKELSQLEDSFNSDKQPWRIVADGLHLKFTFLKQIKVKFEVADIAPRDGVVVGDFGGNYAPDEGTVRIGFGENVHIKPYRIKNCHHWQIRILDGQATLSIANRGIWVSVQESDSHFHKSEVLLIYNLNLGPLVELQHKIIRDLELVVRELTEPCPETEEA